MTGTEIAQNQKEASTVLLEQLAPIAIFAYRRPDHLRRTIESLLHCGGFVDSPVYVFVDGPKHESERADVEATRAVAQDLLGERAIYQFHEGNLGLSRSVMSGVEQVLAHHDRIIVIEDDLLLAPHFLRFMNEALEHFADDEAAFQVSGYLFGQPVLNEPTTALFLPMISSWGWATWKRAWQHFDPQATGWKDLRHDRRLRRRFNLDGTYDYATMLLRQMTGKGDSWAIRWYWSVFKANGLVLYPPRSLVSNIGLDGSGTHGSGRLRRIVHGNPAGLSPAAIQLPTSVGLNSESFESVKDALRWQNGRLLARAVDKLRWIWAVLASYGTAR